VDPWPLHFDGADSREDRPLGEIAIANDLLSAAPIDDVGVIVNPGSDLGVNCLG
jgi:hypothetical protein